MCIGYASRGQERRYRAGQKARRHKVLACPCNAFCCHGDDGTAQCTCKLGGPSRSEKEWPRRIHPVIPILGGVPMACTDLVTAARKVWHAKAEAAPYTKVGSSLPKERLHFQTVMGQIQPRAAFAKSHAAEQLTLARIELHSFVSAPADPGILPANPITASSCGGASCRDPCWPTLTGASQSVAVAQAVTFRGNSKIKSL